MKKEIVASVDVGDNIARLLEKLAEQIGTTADKVFPWYVQQSILQGWLFIIICTTMIIFSAILLFICYKKADFNDPGNEYTLPAGFGIVAGILSIIVLVIGGTWAVTSILNPNYHAMQELTKDMARLMGR